MSKGLRHLPKEERLKAIARRLQAGSKDLRQRGLGYWAARDASETDQKD